MPTAKWGAGENLLTSPSDRVKCVGCNAIRVPKTTIELPNKSRMCFDCVRTAVSKLVTKVKGL